MEPGDSAQGVAAVEVAHERPPRSAPTFFHGACAGIAVAAVVAQVWLAVQLAPLRGAFKDFGEAMLPFTLRSWWLYGVPGAGAVIVAALVALRPRSVFVYALAAALLVGAAIATWHYAYAPLWQLADDIKE
jgi:hypothetical protein